MRSKPLNRQSFSAASGLQVGLATSIIPKNIDPMQKTLLTLSHRFSQVYPKSDNLASSASTFYANQLITNLRTDLSPLPKPEGLTFGRFHSDHMITVDYHVKTGWSAPVLGPFEDLKLSPFSSCLHYAVQCFDGLKAYRNPQGEIRLFRPQANAKRFKRSSVRLTLPDFDGHELLKLIKELVRVQQRWIPAKSQFSLYIRPLHIGVDSALGVHAPDRSKLLIMTGPVGPYYSTGFEPISLYCATDAIRSARKGTGSFKIGGNYAPTIKTSTQVVRRGHQQALWLLDDQIIEVGSSNIFFVFKDAQGKFQIATPELEDLILPGVTRDSILEMLRDEGEYKVSERRISIHEVIERHSRGELIESFGAGTAVIVNGVNNIEYAGTNYKIPVDQTLKIGRISHRIRQRVLDIQEGRAEDKYGWITRVK